MARLRLLAAVAALACAAAYTCTDDDGCERLGRCVSGACVCAPGFTGPSCGSLDFAPLSGSGLDAGLVWPKAKANADKTASAWGFTLAHDPSDGRWHGMVAVACNGSGVVADGGGQSWIAHVVSDSPDAGGFELAGMFTPQTTFGPHVVTAQDGTFVLIFRVNVLLNSTLCGGNGTDPLPASYIDGSYISPNDIVSGDPEKGTSIYVAWASRMAGPWSVARINITGAGDVHKSNPSILQLPDGSWAMAYRYNDPVLGSLNAVAVASDFRGPYNCVANITAGKEGDEDPFIWRQPDGSVHVCWHNHQYGYHGWGPLDGSAPWRVSPTGSHFFTLNVSLATGGTLALQRRERPEIQFDPATGLPLALYNGVVAPDGTAVSFVQQVQS